MAATYSSTHAQAQSSRSEWPRILRVSAATGAVCLGLIVLFVTVVPRLPTPPTSGIDFIAP